MFETLAFSTLFYSSYSVMRGFCLYASDGRIRVQRTPGESSSEEHSTMTYRPHSRLVVRAAFTSYNLRSNSVFLQGKMTIACYIP